jgi:hypothetical protein
MKLITLILAVVLFCTIYIASGAALHRSVIWAVVQNC